MKQLAMILVLALLICACGCQPASLSSGGGESTEPSGTAPSMDVPDTEPSETEDSLGGEDTTPATELPGTPIEYLTLVEDDGIYGDSDSYERTIGIMRSREECPDWVLELLNEKAEDYGEDYFNDHTVVVIGSRTGSPSTLYRAVGAAKTEDSSYLLHLECCSREMGADVVWYSRVAIVVNCAIPEDADIQVVTTTVIMSNEEFEAYFGDTGC